MSISGKPPAAGRATLRPDPPAKDSAGMTQGPGPAPRPADPLAGNIYAVISMVAWAAGFPRPRR